MKTIKVTFFGATSSEPPKMIAELAGVDSLVLTGEQSWGAECHYKAAKQLGEANGLQIVSIHADIGGWNEYSMIESGEENLSKFIKANAI